MTTKSHLPAIYIYLDITGIESLYAQTTDRIEVELARSKERGHETNVSGKLSLGEILKLLLGLGTAEVNIDLARSRKQIEEAKLQMTVEHKLAALLQYLEEFGGEDFFTDIKQAKIRARQSGQPVFVEIREHFDMPQFYPSRGGVNAVNQMGAVVFEIGNPVHPRTKNRDPEDDYDTSDNYFKHRNAPVADVTMTASLEKFTRVYGNHMTETGHEGIMFRVYGGRRVPLTVVGYLKSIGDLYFQLKPYAIAL